jgi:hypothetical protein
MYYKNGRLLCRNDSLHHIWHYLDYVFQKYNVQFTGYAKEGLQDSQIGCAVINFFLISCALQKL